MAQRTGTAEGLSAEERQAVKDLAAERRLASRLKGAEKAAAEAQEVLEKIAAMDQPDRGVAERIHALVLAAAPALAPRTWYGMPAYAKDGKIVCYFQNAGKFKARYSTFGFNDPAALDDGAMWPTAFAVTEAFGDEDAARLTELVRRAAG